MAISVLYPATLLEAIHAIFDDTGIASVSAGTDLRQAAMLCQKEGFPLKPMTLPSDSRTSIRILASHLWFEDLKKQHAELSDMQIILYAANGFVQGHQSQHDEYASQCQPSDYASILPLKNRSPRPQQEQLADFLTQRPGTKPFRICEASTGIGKGLALVAAAVQSKQHYPDKQVIIAAPTLAILRQLSEEYGLIEQQHGLSYRVEQIVSKQDFLSEKLATYWCDENPKHPDAAAFKEQMASTRSFLVADYEQFDSIPLNEMTVFDVLSGADDAGYGQYERSKQDCREADIVFCTFSMVVLSLLQIRRQTRDYRLDWQAYELKRHEHYILHQQSLPFHILDNQERVANATDEELQGFFAKQPLLFLDEAHMFDQIIELTAQNVVPLHNMTNTIKSIQKMSTKPFSKKLATIADATSQLLDVASHQKAGNDGQIALRGRMLNNYLVDSEQALHHAVKVFSTKPNLERLVKTSAGRKLLRYLNALKVVQGDNFGVNMRLSPVRKFISLVSTNPDTRLINDLMTRVMSGVSYTSATLYVPSSTPPLNGYTYIARRLQCPLNEVATHNPLISSWLMSGVEALTVPYVPEFDPANEGFNENAAYACIELLEKSTGGTLVLCTSYDQIETLSRILRDVIPTERILIQHPNQSINALKARYLQLYKEGKKPIWLATGAAWTGLDISDHEARAEDDKAIEQLIIVKLPFDINQKGDKYDVFESSAQCLFRLKQGAGRLIRRENRGNTRLVLLDGRIHQPVGAYRPLHEYFVVNYGAKPLI
jgi:CRISPR type IV-associated DEAD/DEAH-box helicase Csf4